eukprot:CAMPEP_0182827992 /NCGR_PEP_ID=MMETSP0006_2-20121128/17229_1 /TAXON_ID=97485 /ORGANISM="Prymnesium parvum, Strain Texoma1" /LENGTH=156 /DNA_ID=CAMNT_0024955313 /DNA_START=112 /DNA_END=581 /DNA_ORIENTATION=-
MPFSGESVHPSAMLRLADCTVALQVKEGHDSTVKPKIEVWEFHDGRRYLDAWAADSKPYFSRTFVSRVRAAQVAFCAFLVLPWGLLSMEIDGVTEREHVLTPLRNFFWSWYGNYMKMDHYDLKKARSVGQLLPQSPVPRPERQVMEYTEKIWEQIK